MEIKNELLKIQLEDFITEYNDIINKLFLLRDKIISDSKIRFDIIEKEIIVMKDNTFTNLEENKSILKELSKQKETESIDLYSKKRKQLQKKHKELKSLVDINKEDYDKELNNFINVFNIIYGRIINLEDTKSKELEYFKNYAYFNEKLIDELIELFEKYLLCVIKGNKLNEEIILTNDENVLNNKKKGR